MANYPTTVFSPTTKNAGDTIAASHVNDLQAEVTAIETALLTTGLAHLLSVVAFGTHTFSAGGTGANTVAVANTTSGTGNFARLQGTAGTSVGFFDVYSQGYTTGSYDQQSGAALVAQGAGGLKLAASHASGTIGFYTGGTTSRGEINASGSFVWQGGVFVGNDATGLTSVSCANWPTTGNAANAYVANAAHLARSTSSLRYKTDVERLDAAHAKAVIASLKPITYRGIHDGETRFAGFAAEEVAEVDSLLVTRDEEGRPDYVTYDRIPAYLVPVVQDLERRLSALEAR